MLVNALAMAAAIAIAIIVASNKFFEETVGTTFQRVLIVVPLAGLVAYFAPKLMPFWAVVASALIVLLMTYTVMWWDSDGSTVKEFLAFLVIQVFLVIIAEEAATKGCDGTEIGWVQAIFKALPAMWFIFCVGFMIWDILAFHEWLDNPEGFKPQQYLDTLNNSEDEEQVFEYQSALKRRWAKYEKGSANHNSSAGTRGACR